MWHKSRAAQGWRLWFVGGSLQGLTLWLWGWQCPDLGQSRGLGYFWAPLHPSTSILGPASDSQINCFGHGSAEDLHVPGQDKEQSQHSFSWIKSLTLLFHFLKKNSFHKSFSGLLLPPLRGGLEAWGILLAMAALPPEAPFPITYRNSLEKQGQPQPLPSSLERMPWIGASGLWFPMEGLNFARAFGTRAGSWGWSRLTSSTG